MKEKIVNIIIKLFQLGWIQKSLTKDYWTYEKNNWLCIINWHTNRINFNRIMFDTSVLKSPTKEIYIPRALV